MDGLRKALDRYAAETALDDDYRHPSRESFAPKSFAALRAILNLHQPGTLNAAATLPGGTCRFCHLGALLRITTSAAFNDGAALNVHPVHEHADPNPKCVSCREDDSGELMAADWPCSTAEAIESALEAP